VDSMIPVTFVDSRHQVRSRFAVFKARCIYDACVNFTLHHVLNVLIWQGRKLYERLGLYYVLLHTRERYKDPKRLV
jgi:hypothetical protein